jgi:pentatricopeptide repeat protein
MLPREPEDWPSVFTQHLNAGDLDEVMSLYERMLDLSPRPVKRLSAAIGFEK